MVCDFTSLFCFLCHTCIALKNPLISYCALILNIINAQLKTSLLSLFWIFSIFNIFYLISLIPRYPLNLNVPAYSIGNLFILYTFIAFFWNKKNSSVELNTLSIFIRCIFNKFLRKFLFRFHLHFISNIFKQGYKARRPPWSSG